MSGAVVAGVHQRYETELTMKDPHTPPSKRGTFRYGGKVKSDAQACVNHRVVTLYRKVGDLPAEALATDEADSKGKWYVDWDVNSAGKYYGKVKKENVGQKTCLGDKSDVFVDET